jgi:hypothetical protein
METFDTLYQASLLDSPERALGPDPLGDFELLGEMRWLIRWN